MQLIEIDGERLFHILNRIAASAAAESYHNLAVAKHCLELFPSLRRLDDDDEEEEGTVLRPT